MTEGILASERCGTSSLSCPRCRKGRPYFIKHTDSDGEIQLIEMICEYCSPSHGPVKELSRGNPRINAVDYYRFLARKGEVSV